MALGLPLPKEDSRPRPLDTRRLQDVQVHWPRCRSFLCHRPIRNRHNYDFTWRHEGGIQDDASYDNFRIIKLYENLLAETTGQSGLPDRQREKRGASGAQLNVLGARQQEQRGTGRSDINFWQQISA